MIAKHSASQFGLFLLGIVSWVCCTSPVAAQNAAARRAPSEDWLQIRVGSPSVAVFQGSIRIGDLASVESENAALANRVRELDLDALAPDQKTTEISRNQILYRLILAGIPQRQIAITGEAHVTVEWMDSQQVLEHLSQTIQQQIHQKYGTPLELSQVGWRPEAQSLIERSRINWQSVSIEAQLPEELSAGDQTLSIACFSGSLVQTLPLPAVVRLGGRSSGTALSPTPSLPHSASRLSSDFKTLLPRPQFDPQIQPVSYELVEQAGTAALRRAPQTERLEGDAILVRKNSQVRVQQSLGSLVVVLKTARAVQNGKLGEVIEVIAPYRNRSGGETRLLGKVVGDGTLELIR